MAHLQKDTTETRMRRKDKEILSREQIDAIIRGSNVLRLALAIDNSPYLVPLSFGYDGNAFYLHTAREGKKIAYFKANDRVCFECERNVKTLLDNENGCESGVSYESVIGYGRIQELIEPEHKEHALAQIMQHYSGTGDSFNKASVAKVRVWKISIDSLTGKQSPPSKKSTPSSDAARQALEFWAYISRSIARIIACLDGLSEEALNWRPAKDTSSLYVLAAHILGNVEENILGVLCGQEIHRQRDAEFAAHGTTAEPVQSKWRELQERIENSLEQLPPGALNCARVHPRRGEIKGWEVLIVVARHAAEHMGHAELTRELLSARG